jgi:protein SCO1/2
VSRLRQKKLFPKLIFALFAAVVFVASYYLGNQYARPLLTDISATVLPDPEKIHEFQLSDKYGEPFTSQSFKNFWNFVMVGNLHDSGCDSLLRLYVMAWNQLASHPELQKKTRIVFIDSSQPGKTPQQLRKAIGFYNPAFTAATGTTEEINDLGQQLGLIAAPGNCIPDTSVVALIDPEGYMLALFTGLTDPALIARDLQYFN